MSFPPRHAVCKCGAGFTQTCPNNVLCDLCRKEAARERQRRADAKRQDERREYIRAYQRNRYHQAQAGEVGESGVKIRKVCPCVYCKRTGLCAPVCPDAAQMELGV